MIENNVKTSANQVTTVREKLGRTVIVAGVAAMPLLANAAELDFTGASGELAGVQTAILGLIGILVTIFGIVLGWRTFRRSAN